MRLIGENIELIPELADDLGLVRMDPAEVQQIILNLVLNARDAMPDGGRVTLITRNCDEPVPGGEQKQSCDCWVEFAVSDTGCGMDAETRAHLFEPFFTTKKAGKRKRTGASHRVSHCDSPRWLHKSGERKRKRHASRGAPAASRSPIPTSQHSPRQKRNRPGSESEGPGTEKS